MEATAAPTHTSTDIRFAAYIADEFGGRLLTDWQGPLFYLFGFSRSRADLVLRGVVGAVRNHHREVYGELPPKLPRSWRRDYLHSISAAARVISRTPSVLGGVPILARTDSPVEGCAVFNVFSPLALQALALSTSDDHVYKSGVSISEAQSWGAYAREYVPKTPWVKVVEPREASRGFMALLADSAVGLDAHEVGDRLAGQAADAGTRTPASTSPAEAAREAAEAQAKSRPSSGGAARRSGPPARATSPNS